VSAVQQSAQRGCREQTSKAAPRPVALPALLSAAGCLLSFAAFWIAQRVSGVSMIDLMVYRAEGWTVRTGGDLYAMRATYAELPATYPPFAALLFLPLTVPDVAAMRTGATAGNLLLLVAVVHLSLRLLGRPSRPAVTFLAAAVAVWCEPLWTTLRYGQVNLLLTVLVLWDLTRRPGRRGDRFAGAGIGVAAGIKLTPALFAVFLALYGTVRAVRRYGPAWNRELRQAAVATGTFAGTVLLGALILPYDSHRFWFHTLFQSERAGNAEITDNQSLRGVVARLLHTGDPGWAWLVPAVVVGLGGLAVAVAAALAGARRLPHAPAWAALACACTALLVSPVSWSHHWVWCVPTVLLLGVEASERRRALPWRASAGAAAVVFCSYALWWVPHGVDGPVTPELHQSGGQMALSALYPAAGLGFLALAGALAVRALREQATHGGESGRQAVAKE
jgi:hypothetical protein